MRIFEPAFWILIQFCGLGDKAALGVCFETWLKIIKKCLYMTGRLVPVGFHAQDECFGVVLSCEDLGFTMIKCKVQIWGAFAVSGGKLALLDQRISLCSSFLRWDFNSISVPSLEKKVHFSLKQLTFPLANDCCHPPLESLSPPGRRIGMLELIN